MTALPVDRVQLIEAMTKAFEETYQISFEVLEIAPLTADPNQSKIER